jgi:pyruvate/2-oxoglutarate dehydrogenase complex dihydrolipoamide dehydrogenase (E3) component
VESEYDLVVLGCGEGGKYLAWTLARQGRHVVVIDRQYIGGSCPNIACLPSKNIIHSAKVASYFFRSEEFGISKGNVQISMAGVRDRKCRMVDGLIKVHLDNFKSSGAELLMGAARFVAPKTLEVTLPGGQTRTIRGSKVAIGTGSRAALPAIPGLRESQPLTHIEALELVQVPGHLIVFGSGYVGLEFAQAMRRFGSEVTVIGRGPGLIYREDEDTSKALESLFRDEGIDLCLGARVEAVEGVSGQSVRLRVQSGASERWIEGTHLLVAVGRTPNTAGIGLDAAGVAVTDQGFIQVDEHLRTTAPGVWAIGDCAGSPFFTHISFDDFRVVRDDMLGVHRVTTGRQVPFCLFTDPELARIGLNETEARQKGIAYRLVAYANPFGNPRLYEGPHRHEKRSHPGIHRVWRWRRRNHGCGANRHDRTTALHRRTRCSADPSYAAGRINPVVFRGARGPLLIQTSKPDKPICRSKRTRRFRLVIARFAANVYPILSSDCFTSIDVLKSPWVFGAVVAPAPANPSKPGSSSLQRRDRSHGSNHEWTLQVIREGAPDS